MKLLSYIQNNKKQILAIVLGAFLLYLPMLLAPQFGLLNDGWYINMSHSVSIFDLVNLALFHTGRLIPFTLLFYDGLLTLVGHRALGLTILYALELALIGVLVYGLVRRYATTFQSTLAACATLFTASFVTNFYEFFTQDHISLVLLLVFTYLYFKKKTISQVILSFIVLLLFLITKETNIFMVGVFLGVLGFNLLEKRDSKLDIGYLLLTLLVFIALMLKRSAFDATFESGYSLENIIPTALSYIKLLHFNLLIAAAVLWKFVRMRRQNTEKFKVQLREYTWFLLVGLCSFVIYLPWGAAADRYMIIPVTIIMILFFSLYPLQKNTKLLNALVALTILANLFFVSFHIVRFYGARQGDAALLEYLVEHAGEYDQVCVQSASGSPEDVLQLHIWINKIQKQNIKVCSLAHISDSGLQYYFDVDHIAYNNAVQLTDKTLFVSKDYTGIPKLSIDEKYEVEIKETLETTYPNIHPTRGFEYKHFNWHIGTVKLK